MSNILELREEAPPFYKVVQSHWLSARVS